MKINPELILILSMVVLLATSGIVSQTPVAFVFADEEGGGGGDSGGDGGGDSGGDGGGDSGGDGGGDSGGDGGGGGDKGGDSGGEDKQESSSNDEGDKQGTSEGGKESNDAPQEDNNGAVSEEPKQETKNPEDLKGTPEEQEQAAIDDYINEEPGIKKPYPPVEKDKPIVKEPWVKNPIPKHIGNHPIDKPRHPVHHPYPDWCDKHKDGCDHPHPKKNWCDWHKCNDDHHKHNHHNDHSHYDKVTKNYYYDYNNDYNNNHATVILQPDYSHSNNYHDIRVVIGDEYAFDTVVDFSGKPENLVVTGLDINAGEAFDVCMKNQNDGGQTNCVTAHLQDEDKAVYVDIRVP